MKTFWSNYKSSVILLASMIIGGIVGAIWGEGATVLEPVADIFLHLLYCCVVPLIFCSLSSAIAKMQDMKKLRKILLTFLALTFATGVISALFQAVSVILFDPAKGAVVDMTEKVTDATGSLNILGMFTVGDFPQLFSKSNLMALIVFTILFAFAIIKTGEKGRPVVEALDRLTAVIVNLINIVMKIAPIGLGCYFAMLIGQYGSSVVGPLGRSIVIYLVVSILYFVISQTVMAYIGAGKEGVKTWWKGCVAPALTALGTCSSAATLPVNMQHAREIGIPEDVADVAIPLGANLHKDGSCMIQIVKIVLLCGSLIVIWIGIGLIRSKASLEGGKDVNVPLWKAAATACVVTWFNPQAIIDGTMMLGAYRATLAPGTDGLFIAGFASASLLWFNFLGTLVSLVGSKINEKVLTILNKVCGVVIIFYGLKLAYNFCQLMGWF